MIATLRFESLATLSVGTYAHNTAVMLQVRYMCEKLLLHYCQVRSSAVFCAQQGRFDPPVYESVGVSRTLGLGSLFLK